MTGPILLICGLAIGALAFALNRRRPDFGSYMDLKGLLYAIPAAAGGLLALAGAIVWVTR